MDSQSFNPPLVRENLCMKQLLGISTQLASPRDPRGPLQSLPVAVPTKRYPKSVEFGTQIDSNSQTIPVQTQFS